MTEQTNANRQSRILARSSIARCCAYAALAAATLGLAGCSESAPPRVAVYPVQGKLELNGKPAAGAVVVLHPKGDAAQPGARAQVQADGTFVAGTYGLNDGAAEGDYIVTVEWFKPVQKDGEYIQGPNLVPQKYTQPQTSQLEIHVAAQPNELPPITLKR